MGVGVGHKSSCGDIRAPNPNPSSFQIRELEQINALCIATIYYPQCTTHKGNKILVFEDTKEKVSSRIFIDPHFLDNDKLLIARFPATKKGKEMAQCFALAWTNRA